MDPVPLPILRKPVISIGDVAKARNLSLASAAVWITRQAKAGRITKISKGKYAITEDVFAIATAIVQPSYLSFASALYLRGFLEQTVSSLQVVVPHYRKDLMAGNTPIKFITFSHRRIFGYERMPRGDFFAFVAEPEKAIMDCLYAPRHFPISYLEGAFKEIDQKKAEAYALRMDSVSVVKRAGYLLEHFGYDTSLAKKPLTGVHYLEPGKKGTWSAKWRMYV